MARRTGDKYRTIIEAAIKVIADNGFHNSQVSKIAREAGVADGTIYLYFKNKEDILISLFKVKMGEFTAVARSELDKTPDPFEQLAKLISLHLTRLEEDRNLAMVLQIQLRQSDVSIRKAIAPPLKDYFKLIEEIVSRGQSMGVFRNDLNIKVTRQIIFGAIDEVATSWVLSSKNYSLTAQIEPIYKMLAQALSVNCQYPPFPGDVL